MANVCILAHGREVPVSKMALQDPSSHSSKTWYGTASKEQIS